MADERVRRIAEAVTRAQVTRDLQVRQSLATHQAREAAEKAQKEVIRAQNIERLRATGVVDLFEGLRDAGILKYDEKPVYGYRKKPHWLLGDVDDWTKISDYTPARVEFLSDGTGVSIIFNGGIDYEEFTEKGSHEYHQSIEASLGNDGGLRINGKKLEGEETAGGVVEKEVLRAKGLL